MFPSIHLGSRGECYPIMLLEQFCYLSSVIVGLDPFGFPTIEREWDDGSNSIENAKRRLRVAFQFMSKLGVKYWTFHDRYLTHA